MHIAHPHLDIGENITPTFPGKLWQPPVDGYKGPVRRLPVSYCLWHMPILRGLGQNATQASLKPAEVVGHNTTAVKHKWIGTRVEGVYTCVHVSVIERLSAMLIK